MKQVFSKSVFNGFLRNTKKHLNLIFEHATLNIAPC